jgi:hypothetical protein
MKTLRFVHASWFVLGPGSLAALIGCGGASEEAVAQVQTENHPAPSDEEPEADDEPPARNELERDVDGPPGPGQFGEAAVTCNLSEPLDQSGQEIAERLAWALWQAEPDAVLLEAAAAGALSSHEQVSAQALRLLRDARSRQRLWDFYSAWLEPAEDALEPLGEIPDLFLLETQSFTRWLSRDEAGTFQALLTAPESFLNEALAEHYDVSVEPGDELVLTELPGDERFGLLTQGLFLSTNPRAPQRGHFIASRLSCFSVPPAPTVLGVDLDGELFDVTTREIYEDTLLSEPTCAACHQLLTQVGFAFEHYDSIGQYRDSERGMPVDSHIEMTATMSVQGEFDGARELMHALADDETVQRCFAAHWLEFLADGPVYLAGLPRFPDRNDNPTLGALDSRALDLALSCATSDRGLSLPGLIATLASSQSVLSVDSEER